MIPAPDRPEPTAEQIERWEATRQVRVEEISTFVAWHRARNPQHAARLAWFRAYMAARKQHREGRAEPS